MARREISPSVLAFLAAHVRDLDDLQLLIRISQPDGRWWDARTVAAELGITESSARSALDHLAKHNLLDIRITGDVRYQYRPGTEELRAAVLDCIEEFRRKPLEMAAAVTQERRSSIRDFADAFRIRRNDDR